MYLGAEFLIYQTLITLNVVSHMWLYWTAHFDVKMCQAWLHYWLKQPPGPQKAKSPYLSWYPSVGWLLWPQTFVPYSLLQRVINKRVALLLPWHETSGRIPDQCSPGTSQWDPGVWPVRKLPFLSSDQRHSQWWPEHFPTKKENVRTPLMTCSIPGIIPIWSGAR